MGGRVVALLFAVVLLAGCTSETPDDDPADAPAPGTFLTNETYYTSGNILLGNEFGDDGDRFGCGGVFGTAEHFWPIPAQSHDGVAYHVSNLTITLRPLSPLAIDMDLYVYDASGTLIGESSTLENPSFGGNGTEELVLLDVAPQELRIEVRACDGANIDYEVEGRATMVAAGV